MLTEPDGIEAVQTAAEAAALESPPLLIVDSVREYFDSQGFGSGPLAWTRIGDGYSNVTYRIERGGQIFVLRRGPRPPVPKSTHDMTREARIQQLVKDAGVPVPSVLAVCSDESILGVPFYVMGFIEGVVITNAIPQALGAEPERAATSLAAIDTLVKLHKVDVTQGEIAGLGRPAGYLGRQVERFGSLWHVAKTREIADVEEIRAWLGANLPESQAASIVHGDYRIGNLMFAPHAPVEVVAILDWEMATLGDPLADLGYLTATYAEEGTPTTPMELTPVTRESGYLTRDDLIRRYSEQMQLDVRQLPWYQTLALWKAAIFCEEIYSRWLAGETPENTEFGPSLEQGVPTLLRHARQFAGLGELSAY